ncbi:MAG: 4-diphosphocytidyl-2-C-methyl-D-erythritol kinase [Alphaproteobacteria bacterium MarineAlpha6_Bin4]|nr:MAG: 4-diphosphocytidyl-2-C-methyl-D-erythritol kinase [Alphaproteobacteria bacterium MarineAlpha6_Bin3]PPR38102.1 MAG: 4-diphosphocytidyl-2-C-methyl-D-erythritol kinase [Alphaproteobacteria bacterium MarineAlpha6_Bin4]|tara:strand:- start:20304 stop:21158 length:855 start_codon:yes stop_codon:yes gene_type:complete
MIERKILKCKAYAKINLFLNVFEKTKENLHNLESLICFLNFYDEITISENKKFLIEVKGPFKKFIKRENIIEKTFMIFKDFSNLKKNYKISLNKRIPVSAGLGGGSADAAAVLNGLNLLNKKKINNKNLFNIAMKIGSDVPACLYNNNVFVSGYGDILTKAPKIPQISVLLINPRKELSTKKVFGIYKKKKNKKKKIILNNKNFFSWITMQENDLQKYSEKLIPEIKVIHKFLSSLNNCFFSKMSGSGPTFFALFKKKVDANKTKLLLKKKYPKWWTGIYSIKT